MSVAAYLTPMWSGGCSRTTYRPDMKVGGVLRFALASKTLVYKGSRYLH